eukprot:ANDGO_08155.mRNA.1 Serine/threonine-protein kinase TIO
MEQLSKKKPLITELLGQLSPENLAELQTSFDAFAHDGKVCLAHFVAVARRVLRHPEAVSSSVDRDNLNNMVDLFEQIDIDKDEHISWSDFAGTVIKNTSFSEFALPEYDSKGHHTFGLPFSDMFRKHSEDQHLERMALCDTSKRLLGMEKNGNWCVLDANSCEVLRRYAETTKTSVLAGCWIADQDLFVVARNDRKTHVFHSATWELVQEIMTSHPILSLSYTSTLGRCFAGDMEGNLLCWDAGKRSSHFEDTFTNAHNSYILDNQYIQDLGLLVSCSSDRTVKFWSLKDNTCRGLRKGHTAGVHRIAYSSHFRLVATAGAGREIILWNTFSEFPVSKLVKHETTIVGLQCAADSPQLLSVDASGLVCIWDLRTFGCSQSWRTDVYPVVDTMLNSATGRLYIAGNSVAYFDRKSIENVERFERAFSSMTISSINKLIFASAGRKLYSWRTDNGELQQLFSGIGSCDVTCLLPVKNEEHLLIGDMEGAVWVYTMSNGKNVKKINVFSDSVDRMYLIHKRPRQDVRELGKDDRSVQEEQGKYALAIGTSGLCKVFCYEGEGSSNVQWNAVQLMTEVRTSQERRGSPLGSGIDRRRSVAALQQSSILRKPSTTRSLPVRAPKHMHALSEPILSESTETTYTVEAYVKSLDFSVKHAVSADMGLCVFAVNETVCCVDIDEGELRSWCKLPHPVSSLCFLESLQTCVAFCSDEGNTYLEVLQLPVCRHLMSIIATGMGTVKHSFYSDSRYKLHTINDEGCLSTWDAFGMCKAFNSQLQRFLSSAEQQKNNRQLYQNRYVAELKGIRGGLNAIKFAYDLEQGVVVALKFFAEEDEFRCEKSILEAVKSPFVIRMLHSFSDPQKEEFCISMEKADRSLHDMIRTSSGLSHEQEQQVSVQIATGLKDLHRQGFISSDMKPKNVMIFGNNFKIIDLDNGRLIDSVMPIKYTPNYCPPEMAKLKLKRIPSFKASRTFDSWGYGMTLYETLARMPYFDGGELTMDEDEILEFLAAEHPTSSLRISESKIRNSVFREIISKCLQFDPEKRWDMDQVLECLDLQGLTKFASPALPKVSFERVSGIPKFQPFSMRTDVVDIVQTMGKLDHNLDKVAWFSSPSVILGSVFDNSKTTRGAQLYAVNYVNGDVVGTLPRLSTLEGAPAEDCALPLNSEDNDGKQSDKKSSNPQKKQSASLSPLKKLKLMRSGGNAKRPTRAVSDASICDTEEQPWYFPECGAHASKPQDQMQSLAQHISVLHTSPTKHFSSGTPSQYQTPPRQQQLHGNETEDVAHFGTPSRLREVSLSTAASPVFEEWKRLGGVEIAKASRQLKFDKKSSLSSSIQALKMHITKEERIQLKATELDKSLRGVGTVASPSSRQAFSKLGNDKRSVDIGFLLQTPRIGCSVSTQETASDNGSETHD